MNTDSNVFLKFTSYVDICNFINLVKPPLIFFNYDKLTSLASFEKLYLCKLTHGTCKFVVDHH